MHLPPSLRTFFSADIDAVLRSAIGAKGLPVVVAAVATRDKIVYQGAHGNASLQSVFRIFSMTDQEPCVQSGDGTAKEIRAHENEAHHRIEIVPSDPQTREWSSLN